MNLLSRLLPFFFLGIMLVLVIVGIILFSYLMILGAIVGLILFTIAWIKGLFAPKPPKQLPKSHRPGQTIDHDDL